MAEPGPHTDFSAAKPEERAAWQLLDAVWDVPVGLGLCNERVEFVRVNQALAAFDSLSVAEHYGADVLERLPGEFAAGLRRAAAGEALDVEFEANQRIVLAKLHSIRRPSDRMPVGTGIVAL